MFNGNQTRYKCDIHFGVWMTSWVAKTAGKVEHITYYIIIIARYIEMCEISIKNRMQLGCDNSTQQ